MNPLALAKSGRVLTVTRDEEVLYPASQFEDAQTLEAVVDVLDILRTSENRTAWQNAFWFTSANGYLAGAAPFQVITNDPERVREIARWEVDSQY